MQKPSPSAARLVARQIDVMNAVFQEQLELLQQLRGGGALRSGARPAVTAAALIPVPAAAPPPPAAQAAVPPPPAPLWPSPLWSGNHPLPRGQREMLFLMASDPEAGRAYTEQVALDFTGPLDAAALRSAWEALARRHEALRILRLTDERAEVGTALPPWREAEIADSDAAAQAALGAELAASFDLSRDGALARATLFRRAPARHLLAITVHHLIADGWSLGLLLAELAELYTATAQGRPPVLPPAQNFRDFVAWAAALPDQPASVAPPAVPPLVLPGDGPGAAGFGGFRLHRRNPAVAHHPGLPDDLFTRVRRAAQRHGASPVMVLLAGFVAFLGRLSGQEHFCVGLPFAGHGKADMPVMAGMASAVLPVEMRLDGRQTFLELIDATRRDITAAQADADRLFAPEPPALPPVTVLFNIDRGVQLTFGPLALEPVALPLTHVKTELFLNALELNGQILFDFDCNGGLVTRETAELWLEGLFHLLGAATAAPETRLADLPLGPLAAAPAAAGLRLADGLGGDAAIGAMARLWRRGGDGAWEDSGLLARADTAGAVTVLGPWERHPRLDAGWVDLDAVEAALRAHPAVAEAAALVEDGAVVAFVIPTAGAPLAPAQLDRYLRKSLPGQALPRAYAELAALPRDASGAIDTAALLGSDTPRRPARPYVAPRGPLEARLAEIWREVLALDAAPGVTEDFFALGGHSLKAVMLLNRLERDFGKTVPVAGLFRAPTIAGLAQLLDRAADAAPIPRLPEDASYVPSHAQSRLWLLDRLDPGQTAYNMGFALHRRDRLDLPAVERALRRLALRHDSLRSALGERGGLPELIILPEAVPALAVHDLREAADPAALALSRAELIVAHPFDLSRAPLWRASLLRLPDEDRLVIGLHHAIGDNWSIGVMVRDLLALLAEESGGAPACLPDLPIQYQDYAAWHHAMVSANGDDLAYWRGRLADPPAPLRLPANRPRRADGGHAGAYRRQTVPAPLAEALRGLAAEQGATLFMVLNAAFRLWLYGVTARRDAVVGTLHAGRDHPALADQMGFFVNTLPLRDRLAPEDSFTALLEQTRRTVLEAFDHAMTPFNLLVETLALPRPAGGNPLFDVALVMDDWQEIGALVEGTGFSLSEVELPVTQFEYTLIGVEHPDHLELVVQYNPDLWDAPRIDQWLEQFLTLLAAAAAAPHRSLDALVSGGDEDAEIGATVVERFDSWRHRDPQAPAVLAEPGLTYAQLGDQADRLAARIAAALPPDADAKDDPIVGVWLPRSPRLIAAVLGVLKAGAAVLMLDPDYPADRLAYMVRDSRCALVVTDAVLAEGAAAILPAGLPLLLADEEGTAAGPLPPPPVPDDLAYVVYTSGSTGQPKGVAIEHGALAAHLAAAAPAYGVDAEDRCLLFASTGVDTAYEQILLPLTHGAALAIADEERYSPADLLASLRRWSISVVDLPPVFWGELIAFGQRTPEAVAGLSLKALIVGGEEMQPSRVAGWFALPLFCGRLVNAYGPTETTITPTLAIVPPEAADEPLVPIGRPLGRRQARLLDESGREVAAGAVGELYLGGEALARGYLHRPDLTAERFVTDPSGARWYRTGDLARLRPDGQLEFHGRADRQIKLRGYRIEPGEIEERLRRHPAVRDAAVTVEREEEEDLLQAWIVAADDSGEAVPQRGELVRHLAETLPQHMIPARFCHIGQLPVAPSGKLDRDALARLPATLITGEGVARRAAVGATETLVCRLCAEVLGLAEAAPEDNFFAIGGHSLKAVQVVSRLREAFSVELSLRDFFAAPTLAALAARLDAATPARQDAIPLLPRDGRLFPPSHGQRRLWLLQSRQPDLVAFNMVAGFIISGPLDRQALARATEALVMRHEILRTRLVTQAAELWQRILPDAGGFALAVEPVESRAAVQRVMEEELTTGFALETEPPLRIRLLEAPDGHALVINVHHIAFDGWSATVMMEDLAALYRAALAEGTCPAAGLPALAGLAPLPLQYADYAAWRLGAVSAEDRLYWLSRFEDETLPVLRLPTDRPRPPVPSGRGDMVILPFGAAASAALKALAGAEDVTLFGLMAALTLLHLHALSRASDIVLGTAVAGRDRQELERQIGFYLNMLPLRAKLDPAAPFSRFLRQVAETATDALAHQDYPFDQLVEELAPAREEGRQPLFDVVLILQNLDPLALDLAGTTAELVRDRSVSAKYDLMYMIEDEGDLRLHLEYARDLFDAATAERFAGQMIALAEAVAADPARPLAALAAEVMPPPAAAAPPAPTGDQSAAAVLADDEW